MNKLLLKLGLFGRLLLLFASATVLFALCMVFGTVTMSENEAKLMVSERQEQLYQMLVKLAEKTVDENQLPSAADMENRVTVSVERDGQHWTTSEGFPSIDDLMKGSERIGDLHFSKYGLGYYLFANVNGTQVAVTSFIANLIIYPAWLVYWPWMLAFLVLTLSYYALKRILHPIQEAVTCAKMISQGQFDYRIKHHQNTELSHLTGALNKMARDLKDIFDAKNELLMAISHELRSPMARMKVSLAMLEDSKEKKELSGDVYHMDCLIEQLLEGERLRQGNKVLDRSVHYLPSLISELLNEKGLVGHVNLSHEPPEIAINVDVGRVQFVIRNLLKNAIQYSDSSEKVELAMKIDGDKLNVDVLDRGPGIPEDRLDKVFTPFFHSENIQNRSTKGVGLGLFLSKRIAEAHEGTLRVQNVSPTGCRFSLKLPIN